MHKHGALKYLPRCGVTIINALCVNGTHLFFCYIQLKHTNTIACTMQGFLHFKLDGSKEEQAQKHVSATP